MANISLQSLKVGRHHKKTLQKQLKERAAAKNEDGERGKNKY